MAGRLENRVAIITGAGRNVGEAIARAFVDEGARVGVADFKEDRAARVAGSINEERAGAALAVTCDVRSGAQVEGMVHRVVESLGAVDILVNNMGIVDHQTVLELEESEWDRIVDSTLKGVFLCTKYTAGHMVERRRGGKIINIASTSGHRARTDSTAYPSAKGGVLNLTRCLAAQLAPYGIRVNSITPNRVMTTVDADERPRVYGKIQNLIGRQCTPKDVANAAVFLATEEADFITGIDIPVDGGTLAV